MSTSITAVNAKLIADAKQFIAEFERAQAGAKKSAQGIDHEVDRLGRSIKKKFSAGDIGKDLMKGLGIGGGFEVARLAAEKMTDYFREQAERAKAIEESIAKQYEWTKKLIALKQNPVQQYDTLVTERNRLQKEVDRINSPDWRRFRTFNPNGTENNLVADIPAETLERRRELMEQIDKLSFDIASKDKEREDAAKAEGVKQLSGSVAEYSKNLQGQLKVEHEISEQRRETAANEAQLKADEAQKNRNDDIAFGIKEYGKTLSGQLSVQHQSAEARREANAEILKEADAYRDLAHPLNEYYRTLERIGELEEKGMLDANEAWQARMEIAERMGLISHEAEIAARQAGEAMASAFEDAIISGRKLSEVLDGLVRDLMRIMIRNSITGPIAESLTGALTGLFRAEGGPVTGGSPYIVGEKGPELFVPSSNGTVIPNHAISSRGSAGNVYQIDARGTDESVVQRLQQALFALAGPGVVERRALSAQVSSLRRGGGMGRALQGV